HVCLPAEFERDHPYVFRNPRWPVSRRTDSSNGCDSGPQIGRPWYDFRREGQPLWEARFSKDELKRQYITLTSHATAGQLQQRPPARDGGLFKREWFANPVKFAPPDRLELVHAWDLASAYDESQDPDFTVGLLMGRDPETDLFYILDVLRGRFSPGQREKT